MVFQDPYGVGIKITAWCQMAWGGSLASWVNLVKTLNVLQIIFFTHEVGILIVPTHSAAVRIEFRLMNPLEPGLAHYKRLINVSYSLLS